MSDDLDRLKRRLNELERFLPQTKNRSRTEIQVKIMNIERQIDILENKESNG